MNQENNISKKSSILNQFQEPLIRDDEIFLRMNLTERIQHLILIVTFLTLIFTGLPLIFFQIKFLKSIFSVEQSFYIRGIIHRIAAVIFILDLIWHLLYTIFITRGRQNFKAMIPRFKDIKDAFTLFWHNLGLTRFLYQKGVFKTFFDSHPYWLFKEPPQYDRYNFIEKFEYWALGWGAVIMIVSGFFMWNVDLSLSLFYPYGLIIYSSWFMDMKLCLLF